MAILDALKDLKKAMQPAPAVIVGGHRDQRLDPTVQRGLERLGGQKPEQVL